MVLSGQAPKCCVRAASVPSNALTASLHAVTVSSRIPATLSGRKRRRPAGERFEHDDFRVSVIKNSRRRHLPALDPERLFVVRGRLAESRPADRLQVHGAEAQAEVGFFLVGLDITAGAADADRDRHRRQLALALAEDREQTSRHHAQE